MATFADKDQPFGAADSFKPGDNVDLERRGSTTTVQGRKMSRIGPPPRNSSIVPVTEENGVKDEYGKLVEMEANDAIKYRTCSWQKTAALLFSEYICLAIMSFPYSYSILGLVPGLILTVVQAAFVLYTSLVVWEFCLRHPETRDVCDIGQMLFWGSKWAWYFTAVMFLLNNTFIQGLHVLTISRYLNTMSGHSICTVGFAAIGAVVSWLCSMPRTFSALSKLGAASAFFTFISVILAAAFAGAEGKHGTAGYNPDPNHINASGQKIGGEPLVLAVPLAGTTFVSGMNAFLNISYTFIGQITLPSFIAEMKNPYDFRKAIWVVTICEVIVFSLVGGIVYGYTGTQYNTAPAFYSLGNDIYKKVSFSFMIPTLVFLGVLYASVSARFVFFRLFEGTRHKSSHTLVGWASWAGILALTWILAFIIAEVIPFFADLLSLMSSLFDSFFGWIFWGVAYIRMRYADLGPGFYRKRGIRGWVGFLMNVFIIIVGFYFLGAGTYTSVESIILDYEAGNVKGVFTCANNG
ncbi:uncharacterized protein PV06_09840 [Exophiala oligosperma]|uniref:Amino acid transporter transmembrane domain-containing protein n=1 Tax=Exophiala oligosperma TaxID=215243 RepID=A0A0D2D645_9EURO|nr:uncharacterized protein PV06_09840 [Exophiala oligosperma]KIW37855.1 hypothetical protein PV06_09840 [Exophiala oligosperma]